MCSEQMVYMLLLRISSLPFKMNSLDRAEYIKECMKLFENTINKVNDSSGFKECIFGSPNVKKYGQKKRHLCEKLQDKF